MSGTRRRTWVLPVVGTVLLGGCGSGEDPSPRVSLPGVDRTPVVRLNPEQTAVARRVGEYHRLLQRAAGGEPVDAAQLSSVTTSAWADRLGQRLRRAAAQRYAVRGRARHTPRTITVAGDSATYLECLDPEGMRLTKNGTVHGGGSVRPDTAVPGTDPLLRTVVVVRSEGNWKVSEVSDGGPC